MSREYPAFPIPSVGIVVVKDGKVLLVQRGHEPGRGRWTIPGGVIEAGETVHEAARREMREECGLEIKPGRLLDTFETITRDAAGRVRFHYLILDILGTVLGGELRSGDDALDARWLGAGELDALDVMPGALKLARAALAQHQRPAAAA